LALVEVGDKSAEPFFTHGELPVYSTIWNVIPHSSTRKSACQWVDAPVRVCALPLKSSVTGTKFRDFQIPVRSQGFQRGNPLFKFFDFGRNAPPKV
jgi:hypothetical protein